MARQYRTREGSISAADTKTALSTLGSQTTPGPLNVPAGMTHLVEVIVAASADHAAANDASFMVRLEGTGLPNGPEVLPAGATGGAIATGQQENLPAKRIPLMVAVSDTDQILLFGEMAGEDVGTAHMAVTLVFDKF